MKKLSLVLVIVFIFGAGLLVSTPVEGMIVAPASAEPLSAPAEATTDLSNSISSALRSLVQRVAILEKQVAELFQKIASIQLIPGPVGPIGPQGQKGDTGDRGPAGSNGGLHLYDANGQNLGVLIQVGIPQINDIYETFDPSSSLVFLFQINDDRRSVSLIPTNGGSVYFTGNNCQGTPFVSVSRHTNLLDYKIILNGNPHYYTEIDGPSIERIGRVAQSRADLTGVCSPSSTSYNESLQLQEINLPFSEPLAWPLEVRVN